MTDRIPAGYVRDSEGRLLIGGQPAEHWAERAGDTPLFVYVKDLLAQRVADFRAAMPDLVSLHYAVKANPHDGLLAFLAPRVGGFDVASVGEMQRALAAGMSADHISFAGPGKKDRELEAAVQAGITLHVESAGELGRLQAIARKLGQKARVALRVNPPFALKGSGMKMGGTASPFGVDAADAVPLLQAMQGADFEWRGFHLFAGSQNLSVEAILESQRNSVQLAAELVRTAGIGTPALVNLGGGFGVPYFPGDKALDLKALGDGLAAILADRPAELAQSAFALELGRWMVAEAGVYLCRVIDLKRSSGEQFVITDGGLHHQLAASGNFGTVIRRNYPVINATRDCAPADRDTAHVVGCLCTPLDKLADKLAIATPEVGDLIAIFMAGAYGRSASPEAFLGHAPPVEILV